MRANDPNLPDLRRIAEALGELREQVEMTTQLAGPATRFLPFNRGNDGAAGKAPNQSGFATAYLWEEVWGRGSWLDTPMADKSEARSAAGRSIADHRTDRLAPVH